MDSHLHIRAVSPNRVAGAVVGACHTLIGMAGLTLSAITGFALGETSRLLVFQANPLYSLLHVVLGIALGLAAYRGLRHAMLMNSIAGALYGALGFVGLILLGTGTHPLAGTGPDSVLHLSSAVVLLGVSAVRR
ncbi:hypothetical protein GCM10025762_29150 [Haloechinothrix salitolerans]